MSKEFLPQELTGSLVDVSIKKFNEMTQGSSNQPAFSTREQFPRTDRGESIREEARKTAGLETFGSGLAGFTLPAAPHTSSTMHTSAFSAAVQTLYDIVPELRTNITDLASHLIVWWWGMNGERMDVNRLSSLSDSERAPIIEVLTRRTRDAAKILRDVNSVIPSEISRKIRVYGLWGHATSQERLANGLARGAQSSPDGHLNVLYLNQDDTLSNIMLEDAKEDEIIKQIGPWDSLFFEEFEGVIAARLKNTVAKRLRYHHVGAEIRADQDHSIRTDGKNASFFEGYRISFDDALPMQHVMNIMLDIVGDFGGFYTQLRDGYEKYHKYKYAGNPGEQERARIKLQQDIRQFGFDNRSSKRLLTTLLSIQPTYLQMTKWVKEQQALGDPSANLLQSRANSYLKRFVGLQSENYRARVLTDLKKNYNVTEAEAALMLRLMTDRVKPQAKFDTAQFVLPLFNSGSYLFEQYSIDANNNLLIKTLTLSSRLGSNKGVIEDLVGGIIRRTEAAQ